ncbi:MAG TPA: winged helix DNA-binding protein [Candidatus Sulfotelmatobacter sp.]|nr:winged helix DNA-binding protein [Candidatus Sulfotelmatobacter sp.]
MTQTYYELTHLIERLHRRYLDVLRTSLDRLGVVDINAVQCMLLGNIGEEEINVRSLMDRGYYLGSNASYNLKRLVECAYLEQQRSPHDRRSTLIRATQKGRDLCRQVAEMTDRNAVAFSTGESGTELEAACQLLRRLERAWEEEVVKRS